MDKENYGWGGIGFLALFFLIIVAFWARGGNSFGGNGAPYPFMGGTLDISGLTNSGLQNFQQICDAEKTAIVDSAQTRYLVEQQAAATRDMVTATANATQTKIDFYAYQDLRDKLSEAERENTMLQNKLFVKEQLAPVMNDLTTIRYTMLQRPNVTGVGVACPSQAILNGLGITTLNNGCNCGSNVIA
jgi:hypothetical protein